MGERGQRKTTDDRWWVPDRNIGTTEEREGVVGQRDEAAESNQNGKEGDAERQRRKGKTQCSQEGGTQRERGRENRE